MRDALFMLFCLLYSTDIDGFRPNECNILIKVGPSFELHSCPFRTSLATQGFDPAQHEGDRTNHQCSKRYLCNCEKHCKQLKEVSCSTYVRHAPYRTMALLETPCYGWTPNSPVSPSVAEANTTTGEFNETQLRWHQMDAAPSNNVWCSKFWTISLLIST